MPQGAPRGRPIANIDYHQGRFGLTREGRSRTPTNRAPRTPRALGDAQPTTPAPPPLPEHQPSPLATSSSAQTTSSSSSHTQAPHTPELPEPPVPTWHPPATIAEQAEPPEEIPVPPDSSAPTSIYDDSSASAPPADTQIAAAAEATLEPTPTLPMKRPHEAMLASIHGRIEPPHHSWDGSPDTPEQPNHSVLFARTAAKQLQVEGYDVLQTDLTGRQSESDAPDSSASDNPSTSQPRKPLLTRKEAKALEREIPWRSMPKLRPEQIQAYIDAARKEWAGWQKWGSIEPLTPEYAAAAMANPATRKRVPKSRACYRNKSKVPTVLFAKARVVTLGHLDPDLASISRDEPTPPRTFLSTSSWPST